MKRFTIKAKLWLYPGETANWHFITVPKKESARITENFRELKQGWGSLPVTATIRKTSWETSIFPDRKSSTYLLPVKALIRKREGLEVDDSVTCTILLRT